MGTHGLVPSLLRILTILLQTVRAFVRFCITAALLVIHIIEKNIKDFLGLGKNIMVSVRVIVQVSFSWTANNPGKIYHPLVN